MTHQENERERDLYIPPARVERTKVNENVLWPEERTCRYLKLQPLTTSVIVKGDFCQMIVPMDAYRSRNVAYSKSTRASLVGDSRHA